MLLAEHIRYLVLTLEVKHIHGKDDTAKEGVLLLAKMLLETAVVVKEDDIW